MGSTLLRFFWNHKPVSIDFKDPASPRPSTTVLQWLRSQYNGKGTKEGCAEGDCGACTVAVALPDGDDHLDYLAVQSCLVFLPWLQGKHLITIEGLQQQDLHPVQKAMAKHNGVQCGFCTSGIIMSIFVLTRQHLTHSKEELRRLLSGNLCRCTGYENILTAARYSLDHRETDFFDTSESMILQQLTKIGQDDLMLEQHQQLYLRPASLRQALEWRKQFPDAVLHCGGTDIALAQTRRYIVSPCILDISGVKEIQEYKKTNENWEIGAGLPLEYFYKYQMPPLFHDMTDVFASRQIRYLATLGGNLGSASPIGDTWPVLIALNAGVKLVSTTGERTLPVADFITGYHKTALQKDELIASIIIPVPSQDSIFRFQKISKRKQTDISTLNLAIGLRINEHGLVKNPVIVFGGMAAVPVRLTPAEAILDSEVLNKERIEEACHTAMEGFQPVSDARASAEGRLLLAENAMRKALLSILSTNLKYETD